MIRKWLQSIASKLRDSPFIIAIERLMVIFAAFVIIVDLLDRQPQHINQAWGIVAMGGPGNSGKIQALEYLNSQSCWRALSWDVLSKNCTWLSLKQRVALNGIDLRSELNQDGPYLLKVNLEEAKLYGAHFARSYLPHSKLRNLKAERINLQYAELNSSDMSNAVLVAASLRFAGLGNVDLENANLQEANLEGAYLAGANLQGTYLGNAHLQSVKGLTCDQLIKAKKWSSAERGKELACGKEIPNPPPDIHKWVPKNGNGIYRYEDWR